MFDGDLNSEFVNFSRKRDILRNEDCYFLIHITPLASFLLCHCLSMQFRKIQKKTQEHEQNFIIQVDTNIQLYT